MTQQVYAAQPYEASEMSSTGRASMMYLRQYQFPDVYDEGDQLCMADSDRIEDRNSARANACSKKYSGGGVVGMGQWFKTATEARILAFMAEYMEADPKVKWTGFRVCGTVHRGNGFPVWTLELFAKHPKTKTKVYTGDKAPNIRQK